MSQFTIKECDIIIKKMKQQWLLEKLGAFEILCRLLKKDKKQEAYMNSKDNQVPCSNTILNGCALIFSPIYILNFDGLDERTYMYGEEFILYEHIIRNGYSTYFSPRLKIFHEHEYATNNLFKSNRKKNLWKLKFQMESMKILQTVIREYDERDKEDNLIL